MTTKAQKLADKIVELFESRLDRIEEAAKRRKQYIFKNSDIAEILEDIENADEETRAEILKIFDGGTDLDAQAASTDQINILKYYIISYLTRSALKVQSAHISQHIGELEREKYVEEVIDKAKKYFQR